MTTQKWDGKTPDWGLEPVAVVGQKEEQLAGMEAAPSVAEARIAELVAETKAAAPESAEQKAAGVEVVRAEIAASATQKKGTTGEIIVPEKAPIIEHSVLNKLAGKAGKIARAIALVFTLSAGVSADASAQNETGATGGRATETVGATAEIRGSTGREFLSKDYMSKLKQSGAGFSFDKQMVMSASRNITAHLVAYNELLSAGKTEDAKKHLEAIRILVDMADKTLGVGVIDKSKILGLE